MASSNSHRREDLLVESRKSDRSSSDEVMHFVGRRTRPRRQPARWVILAALLPILAWPGTASTVVAADPTPEQFEADFDALWSSIDRDYAYFDVKQTDWAAVRSIYRPRAARSRPGPSSWDSWSASWRSSTTRTRT